MKLNWNDLHLQSREEICRGACVSMNLASKSWEELEPWLQELLAFSLGQRTSARVAFSDLAFVPSATGVAKVPAADTLKSVL